jgi:hypothetical protein
MLLVMFHGNVPQKVIGSFKYLAGWCLAEGNEVLCCLGGDILLDLHHDAAQVVAIHSNVKEDARVGLQLTNNVCRDRCITDCLAFS